MGSASLEIRGLVAKRGDKTLLHHVDLDLAAGELVALVGSSGSGKTLSARAAAGLLPFRPGVVGGALVVRDGAAEHRPYAAKDTRAVEAEFRKIRGRLLAWMPQDAVGGLDPLSTVGAQIRAASGEDPRPWLTAVGLRETERVAALHPYALSGGMAQRVSLARALSRKPSLLFADEATTGLDPTAQDGLLRLLRRLCDDGLGVLLITHDLPLAARFAHRVVVMFAGRTVADCAPDALASHENDAARALWAASHRLLEARP